MDVRRPYDRAQPPLTSGTKFAKSASPSKRAKDGSSVEATRSPAGLSNGLPFRPKADTRRSNCPPGRTIDSGNDAFSAESNHRSPKRVQKWVVEQQRTPTSRHSRTGSDDSGFWQAPIQEPPSSGTPSNPYLAYPNMGRYTPSFASAERDNEVDSLHSYVIVEEDEHSHYDQRRPAVEVTKHNLTHPATPDTPTFRNTSSSRAPSRPWHNIHLPMTLPTRISSTGAHIAQLNPFQTPKKSVFRRLPLPDTFRPSPASSLTVTPPTPESYRATRQNEPLVTPKASRNRLSNLTLKQYPISSTTTLDSSSPRPSTSSAATSTLVDNHIITHPVLPEKPTSTTNKFRSRFAISLSKASQRLGAAYVAPATLGHHHHSPNKSGLESPSKASFMTQDGTQSRSTFSSSTQTFSSASQQSQSDTASYIAPSVIKDSVATLKKRTATIFKEKNYNASSSALSIGKSSVFSTSAKRKKLVVSGIARGDGAAVEGLRRWCETFGEVRQVSRNPNGDLHVDFKRADVADTVCRISAQVFIEGVGSVFLSWCTGKKH